MNPHEAHIFSANPGFSAEVYQAQYDDAYVSVHDKGTTNTRPRFVKTPILLAYI